MDNFRSKSLKYTSSSVILVYTILIVSDWYPFKLMSLRAILPFVDLYTVLTAAKCFQDIGFQVYINNAETPLCFFVYGHTLLDLVNILHLSPQIILLLGYSNILLVLGILLWLSSGIVTKSNRMGWFVSSIICSPPIWLLLERGNVDSLIFILLILAAFFLKEKRELFGLLFINVTILFKFYTLPLLLLAPIFLRKSKSVLIAIVSMIVIAPYIYQDIIIRDIQEPGSLAFGTPMVTFWINSVLKRITDTSTLVNINEGHAIGILLLILIVCIVYKLKYKNITKTTDPVDEFYSYLFILSSVSFLSCFLSGMNYDYRLILMVVSCIALLNFREARRSDLVFMAFMQLGSWLTCFSFGLPAQYFLMLQWVGGLSQFVIAGYFVCELRLLLPNKVSLLEILGIQK